MLLRVILLLYFGTILSVAAQTPPPIPGTPPIDLTSNTLFSPIVKNNAIWGMTGCTIMKGNPIVTCPALSYAPVPVSGSLVDFAADDVGENMTTMQRTLLVSAVSNAVLSGSSLTITLSTAPSFSNYSTYMGTTYPVQHVAYFDVTNGGAGYHFGSTQTLMCASPYCATGDGHVDAVGTPAIMTQVNTPVVSGGASGGTPGCTTPLTPATQTGIKGNTTLFSGSIDSSGAFTFSSVTQKGQIVSDSGMYTSSPPPGYYTDTLIGCGYTVSNGPTAKFAYSIVAEQITPGTGIYQGNAPCNPIGGGSGGVGTNTSTGDGGSNLALDCTSPSGNSGQTYPGTAAVGTDNQAAFQAAIGTTSSPSINTMNWAAANGRPECFYLPPGNYLTKPTDISGLNGLYLIQGYGCFLGNERLHSNIFVEPNTGGNLFGFLDCNQNSSLPNLGITQTFAAFAPGTSNPTGTANQAGTGFRSINITGDRLTTASQNALAFYGKTAYLTIDNAMITFMKGRAIWAGLADANMTNPNGDLIESTISNSRFEQDGNNSPAIEITSNGKVDASNTNTMDNIRIYEPFGDGLWIHNSSSTASNNIRFFRLSNFFFEGSKVSQTTLGGHLLEIGDPALHHPAAGMNVSNVVGTNIQLNNPILGYDALYIAGDSALDTTGIDIEGSIIGGQLNDPGRGLQVEACSQCGFRFAQNNSTDYNLLVGLPSAPSGCASSSIGTPGIVYDAIGGEASLSTCIDTAAAGLVSYPVRQTLLTAVGTTAPVNAIGDLVSTDPAVGASTITVRSTSTVTSPILPINTKYPLWTLLRTGTQTGSFTDTLDMTPNILAALTAVAAIPSGSVFHLRICNQTIGSPATVSPTESIMPGDSGTSLTGVTMINPGQCVPYTVTVTSSSTLSIIGG